MKFVAARTDDIAEDLKASRWKKRDSTLSRLRYVRNAAFSLRCPSALPYIEEEVAAEFEVAHFQIIVLSSYMQEEALPRLIAVFQ